MDAGSETETVRTLQLASGAQTGLAQGLGGWPHPPWASVSSFAEQRNQPNHAPEAEFYRFMEQETAPIW